MSTMEVSPAAAVISLASAGRKAGADKGTNALDPIENMIQSKTRKGVWVRCIEDRGDVSIELEGDTCVPYDGLRQPNIQV